MLIWCSVLFILGILAFLDTILNYGDIFRRVNSMFFMLISLGLLVRTSMKMKLRKTEILLQRIEELEEQLSQICSRKESDQHNHIEKS